MKKILSTVLLISALFLCACSKNAICDCCGDYVGDDDSYYLILCSDNDFDFCRACYYEAVDFLCDDFRGSELEYYLACEKDAHVFSSNDIYNIYALGLMDGYKNYLDTGKGAELFEVFDYDALKEQYDGWDEY